ncbi:MAG: amino acid adenylation domain-containing protein, partial [bacterium]|nr:amino acid adenylation domain-containing protein [bacterium]
LLHHTGDRGRIALDGTIDLLGRNDRQVKLRGIRIESAEIETLLSRHPSVKEAAVIKRVTGGSEEGNQGRCASITTVTSEEQNAPIKSYLEETCPTYMVPSQIIRLEELPLTSNRKVDYKALADYREKKESHAFPGNPVEEKLLEHH